jgi:hypothetical protein
MARRPRVRAPVQDAAEQKRRKYITAARAIYENDDVEIDSDAKLSESESDHGSWVQAWVWVTDEEVSDGAG